MDFSVQIQGSVGDDRAKHAIIQNLAQAMVNEFAAAGIVIEVTSASTPSGSTTPIPQQPQTPAAED